MSGYNRAPRSGAAYGRDRDHDRDRQYGRSDRNGPSRDDFRSERREDREEARPKDHAAARGPVPMETDAAPTGGAAEAALPAPPPKPAAGPASVVLAPAPEPEVPKLPPIDREKVCPLLLRVFPKIGAHHGVFDYARRNNYPKGEVAVYTWQDASLRELTELVKEVTPPAKRPHARLEFAFVYPDRKGRNVMRTVGSTVSGRPGFEDDAKTLRDLKFEIGDLLDVAVFV